MEPIEITEPLTLEVLYRDHTISDIFALAQEKVHKGEITTLADLMHYLDCAKSASRILTRKALKCFVEQRGMNTHPYMDVRVDFRGSRFYLEARPTQNPPSDSPNVWTH